MLRLVGVDSSHHFHMSYMGGKKSTKLRAEMGILTEVINGCSVTSSREIDTQQ